MASSRANEVNLNVTNGEGRRRRPDFLRNADASQPPYLQSGHPEVSTISALTSPVDDYGGHVALLYDDPINEAAEPASQHDLLRGLTGDAPGLGPRLSSRSDSLTGESILLENSDEISIKMLLDRALEQDKCDKKNRFLPRGDLRSICKYDAVFAELLRIFDDETRAHRCAGYVCGNNERRYDPKASCREVFATLVLINKPHLIEKFMVAKIVDDDLPLRGTEKQTKLWSRHKAEEDHLTFFKHVRDSEVMREFYNKQWWVHVPFIARDKKTGKALEYEFEVGTVLPWTFISEDRVNGGYGEVQRIEIHSDHHFLDHTSFALKTLHPEYGDENQTVFRREINAYRRMHDGNHLVELLATFTIGDRYMLLFPWANGGNLKDLWQTNPISLLTSIDGDWTDFVRWIATECHGMVKDLNSIHGFLDKHIPTRKDDPIYGIHGDIKPENILHFTQDTEHHPLGSLKLGDFGLLKFHSRGSRSKRPEGEATVASPTYRSPQHDMGVISRQFDIWALGCVFSELMTWAIRGSHAVKNYEHRRMTERSYSGDIHARASWNEDNFFVKYIEKPKTPQLLWRFGNNSKPPETPIPRLKQSVKEWINGLIGDAYCEEGDTFFSDFLTFIRDKMLVPQLSDRAQCDMVQRFLQDCLEKGENDESYWLFRVPEYSNVAVTEYDEPVNPPQLASRRMGRRVGSILYGLQGFLRK
ncbi:hypothetical protein PT974_03001 [Cladobotryum mycophilum]|uniref:Protein kinase domain-containing protein n=1 Tax=Cladobotryum mycophilum TaxID=491253 RepID=A0ABR0T0I1_9HYPO